MKNLWKNSRSHRRRKSKKKERLSEHSTSFKKLTNDPEINITRLTKELHISRTALYRYPIGMAIEVFWHEKDNCYYAVVPGIKEFEYISAWGDTPEEAVKEVQISIKLVIETLKKHNRPIPKPIIYSLTSDKSTII
ncbi:MAG: type II toxin-antitoxin system HicB family antitoxin [Spirochaetota bacterium]